MTLEEKLLQLAEENGALGAGIVPVADIVFHPSFRADCEKNTCGHYGKSWTCPPAVGDIDALIGRAQGYDAALVFCSIGKIERRREDGLGFVEKLGTDHYTLTRRLAGAAAPLVGAVLPLGAGFCMACAKCAKMDEEPCRQPEAAMASLESYGIAVTHLAKSANLAYNAGRGTITFFGAILYKKEKP